MDSHSTTIRLRVPTPKQTDLSFCPPTVRDLKLWIANLPKANTGETARLLYLALQELNNFITSAENRAQLLELLRPEVVFITSQLERHFINNAVMLDARSQKVANLCQTLQNHLTAGYKLVITESFDKRSPVLALALQRALHSMFASLVRAYQLYYPAPAHFWLELHHLYVLARQHNLHTQPIRDPLLSGVSEQSAEAAYCCVLLLSCARINQMRKNDIAILAKTLPSWSHLSVLQNTELASSLFIVNLNSDAPPRYKKLINEEHSATRLGFSTEELATALLEYQQARDSKNTPETINIPDAMSSTLIAQLHNAWGHLAKRDFQRTSSQGVLQVCLGMSAVHYYLAGEESFDQTLKLPQQTHVEYITDNSPPDIWASAVDAGPEIVHNPLQAELIEYSVEEEADEDAENTENEQPALYPVYSLEIVNQSPGGYCLAWQNTVPSQLQTGEIIALRDDETMPWTTAVVSWIRQTSSTTTQMGIELIAPNAQHCGLQLLRGKNESSFFLRALLVPEIPVLSRPASVIGPRIPFQEGHKVAINLQGKELKAILNKRVKQTGSISQFEYRLLTPEKSPTLPKQAAAAQDSSELSISDNFDSLWKSL